MSEIRRDMLFVLAGSALNAWILHLRSTSDFPHCCSNYKASVGGVDRGMPSLRATSLAATHPRPYGVAPGARDNRVLDAHLAAERSRGPVCGAVRRWPSRPHHDARFQGRRQHGRLRAAMAGGQSRQTVLREPLLPQGNRPRTAAGPRGDRGVAAALREQQNDPRASRRIRTTASRSHARFEGGALVGCQHERCRWHAPSYDLQLVSTSH